MTAGSDGTVGDKWGCTLKEGEEYTDPPAADPDAGGKWKIDLF